MKLNLNNSSKGVNRLFLTVIACIALNVQTVAAATRDFDSEWAKEIIKIAKAADIKSWMDSSVDPCDDFYKYACGNWTKINRAQKGKINTDKFLELNNGIERRLRKLLHGSETLHIGQVEYKIRKFYESCLITKFEKNKYFTALSEVYKEFGEFSAFKEKVELKEQKTPVFQWWVTVGKILNRYGKSFILTIDILDDIKDKSKTNMVYIGQPQFNMIEMDERRRIKQYLQLYLKIDALTAKSMADNIVAFEFFLIQGATDSKDGKSVEELITLYNTTDLHEKYEDLFDVREFLEVALGTKHLPPQVYVYDESYLEGLHEVFNSTDSDVVQDYILWLFLEEFLVDVTQSNMQEECIHQTKKFFGKFIDHVIYNQYRSNKTEAEIYEIWQDIKNTFQHNLETDKYYWMSQETREKAITKLINMNFTINSYDDDNFIELFKDLQIDPINYVLNVKNILEHAESLRENKLEKKAETDAQTLSFTPNYNILENRIKIPVFMLQPFRIWNATYPKAIQYGTLGYFLAHEMIHGFDDEGRKYDANGQAHNWWDEKSAYQFDSRRECFKDQYHKYEYGGHYLPESDSQSENIADNGGVNIAYDAYKLWLNKIPATELPKSETLPNLDFNNLQLFFISFAQLWCEDVLPEYKSLIINSDVHSPPMHRVIGTLSNSREFTWVFKCNMRDSRMNPPKKCEIY